MSQRWNGDWFSLPGRAVFDHDKQRVAAIARAAGNLDLFVIGFDNRVWSTFWTQADGWNDDWFPLPGQAVFDHERQQVAAVSRAAGNIDLFVIGFDNRVWSTFWSAAGGWNPDWFALPGQAVFDHGTQQVGAVSRAAGNLDLFVIGFDNHVWSTFWTQAGGWSRDWFPLPGQAVFDHTKQQVAAVSRAEGNLDLFVIGFDSHVWSTFWTQAGGWSRDWFALPGQAVFDRDRQHVAALSRAAGNLDLFVIGFDNRVWSTFWTQAGGWNDDWFPLPGQAVFDHKTQRVVALSRTARNIDVFAIGLDNRVWSTCWIEARGWHRNAFPLPNQAMFDHQKQQLAAVSRAADNLDLFVIGFDNRVWSTYSAQQSAELPWAVILCRFKGDPSDVNREGPAETFFREIFTPGTGGLVEYWRDVSMGGVDVSDSRVFDWVEVDIPRSRAAVGRSALVDAAIRASLGRGDDPLTGFHSQIAIYTQRWTKDGAPAGSDWHDPVWAPFWIDGGADDRGKVSLTPPFSGNFAAHEMGHGFGMIHDVGPGLTTASDYSDPACIMSQNGSFILEPWQVIFGPAVCLPHMVQQGWFPSERLYVDEGEWMRAGATIMLAPVTCPQARANLGIRLKNVRASPPWDYYLEYCSPTGWDRGVPGAPYLLIRRIVDIPGFGERPAYLMALAFKQDVGAGATGIEPSGNVRFTVEVADLPGPVLKVVVEAL
jgi:hypothetical protein